MKKNELQIKKALEKERSRGGEENEDEFSDKKLVAEIEDKKEKEIQGAKNILFVSIIADFFTIIPFAGNILAIFFSVVIWIMYFMNSSNFSDRNMKRLIRKTGTRAFVNFLTHGGEIFAWGFSFLPLFTIGALINLAIVKSGKKETVYKLMIKDK